MIVPSTPSPKCELDNTLSQFGNIRICIDDAENYVDLWIYRYHCIVYDQFQLSGSYMRPCSRIELTS